MWTPRPIALALLLLLPGTRAAAQEFHMWNNVVVQGSLSGDLLFTADTSVRFNQDVTRWSLTLVRVGLGWRVSPRLSLFAGYAQAWAPTSNDGRLVEQRLWQQASYPIVGGPHARLTGRTRLEQRRLEGRDGTSWRLRQQVRLAVPIGSGPRAPSLVMAHELLWNVEDGSIPAFREGADQNRTTVGMTVPLGPQLRVEPAWMRQQLAVPDPDRVINVMQITVSLAL